MQPVLSCLRTTFFDFHAVGFDFGSFFNERLSQRSQSGPVPGAGIEQAQDALTIFWFALRKQTC